MSLRINDIAPEFTRRNAKHKAAKKPRPSSLASAPSSLTCA